MLDRAHVEHRPCRRESVTGGMGASVTQRCMGMRCPCRAVAKRTYAVGVNQMEDSKEAGQAAGTAQPDVPFRPIAGVR